MLNIVAHLSKTTYKIRRRSCWTMTCCQRIAALDWTRQQRIFAEYFAAINFLTSLIVHVRLFRTRNERHFWACMNNQCSSNMPSKVLAHRKPSDIPRRQAHILSCHSQVGINESALYEIDHLSSISAATHNERGGHWQRKLRDAIKWCRKTCW